MKTYLASTACLAVLALTGVAHADTILGNWESGTPEGWIDWSNGQTPIGPPRFNFNGTGATVGSGAIQFNLPNGGFTQWAAFKLQNNGIGDYRPDFFNSVELAIDLTFVGSEQVANPGNNFASIGFVVNADGYGFNSQGNPISETPFTGSNGDNSFNPQLLTPGAQTTTWVYDLAHLHDGNAGNGEIAPGATYIEFILDTYSNGGVTYHVDNVRLIAVPEPSSLTLIGVAVAGLVWAKWRRNR